MRNLSRPGWLSSDQSAPVALLPLSAEPSLFSANASLNIASRSSLVLVKAEDGFDGAQLQDTREHSSPLDLVPIADCLTAAPVVTSGIKTRTWSDPTIFASPTARPAPRAAVQSPSPTPTPAPRKLVERWEGWETETSTVYVTASEDVPTAITITETFGESPAVDGGVTTITEYKGESTLTVAGPRYVTLTFFPTTTTYKTERTRIPTTTRTKTSTQAPPAKQTQCKPGDSAVKERSGLKPTHDQSITLYVIAIYIVGIGVGWNLLGLRELLYPYKTLVIGFHEVGHVLSLICLGGSVGEFIISPDPGGQTLVYNLDGPPLPLPLGALPLAYLFNIFIGGLLTFCGFNTLASKIASFILAFCWIGVFMRSGGLGKGMTVLAGGLMVGLWWVDHAWGLRFFVLFVGVMSSFYVIWDVIDDAVFAKQNPCCPAQYTLVMPSISPGIFTLAWFLISFIFFVGFVLAGLATWKESHHAMFVVWFCQAQAFLPT